MTTDTSKIEPISTQRDWKDTVLLVIDVQNDFLPGGSLAVPNGHEVIEPINRLIREATSANAFVLYSRDWHPIGSIHFNKWPKHCVQDTQGAQFAMSLIQGPDNYVVTKGTDAEDDDSYSAFDGHFDNGRVLDTFLQEFGIKKIIVCGLATDYCVKDTCLDGITHGYEVCLIQHACKGVTPETTDEAMTEMINFGVEIA